MIGNSSEKKARAADAIWITRPVGHSREPVRLLATTATFGSLLLCLVAAKHFN
jgi:hypothetical protein